MSQDWPLYEEVADGYCAVQYDPYELLVDLARAKGEESWSLREIRGLWDRLADGMRAGRSPDTLNLFLEVPFCRSRCFYCSFYSVVPGSDAPVDDYLDRLDREMEFLSGSFAGLEFRNLYVGGGTPSLLNGPQIERLFSSLRRYRVSEGGERNFECEPSTVSADKFALLKSLGINRVSIGVQSLDERVLATAARNAQTRDSVLRAVRDAKAAGFDRGVNVDLMLGLAGDTPETFLESFRQVAAEGPEKITLYALLPTREYLQKFHGGDARGFHSGYERFESSLRSELPAEAERAGYLLSAVSQCEWTLVRVGGSRPGLTHYEDSPQRPASILGFGPSTRSYLAGTALYRACGKLGQDLDPARADYAGARLDAGEERLRFALMGLRTSAEIPLSEFRRRFGRDFAGEFPGAIEDLEARGWARVEGDRLRAIAGSARERLLACLRLVGETRAQEVRDRVLALTAPPPAPKPATRLLARDRAIRVSFEGAHVDLSLEAVSPGIGYLRSQGALGLRELMWHRGGLSEGKAAAGLRERLRKACSEEGLLDESGEGTVRLVMDRLRGSLERAGLKADITEVPRCEAREETLALHVRAGCRGPCAFCGTAGGEGDPEEWLPAEAAERELRHAYEQGCRGLALFGLGSGLALYPHLAECLGRAERLGFRSVGLALRLGDLAGELSAEDLLATGADRVAVWLRDPSELAPSSPRRRPVEELLELARERGSTRISAAVVLDALTFRELTAHVKLLRGLGFGEIDFSFLWSPSGLETDRERIPAFRRLMPEVRRLMLENERSRKLCLRFLGIPRCMLRLGGPEPSPRLWEHLAKKYLSEAEDAPTRVSAHGQRFDWAEHRARDLKTLGPRCESCHFLGVCDGVWRSYAEAHGLDELVPVGPPGG